jgi:hypothetical protein
MRKVIGGNGADNTAAALAWLAAGNNFLMRDLIIIGRPEDPRSIWMTNHEAPVIYSPYDGTFMPAVVTRGQVSCKIGLDVQKLNLTWSPSNNASTVNTVSASPAQLARLHFYDNWPVLILRALMPTPGDANTIGCTVWFGGRVDTVTVERNQLAFSLNSYLNVVTQKVPSTVIETTNTLASTAAVTLPAGDTSVPVFQCFTGSSEDQIIADAVSPDPGNIYAGNVFSGGYMVFLSGPGATLAGAWSAIGGNGKFTDGDGNNHSIFSIYSALPWPPTPFVDGSGDRFYVSTAAPVDISGEGNFGFPFVPNPQSGV